MGRFYLLPVESYTEGWIMVDELSLQKISYASCRDCLIQRQVKFKHLTSWSGKLTRTSLLMSLTNHRFPQMPFNYFFYYFLMWLLVVGPAINPIICFYLRISSPGLLGGAVAAHACHPGPKNNGLNRPRPGFTLAPFQQNEYFPKMSEQTIGASGPAEGPIYLDSERYRTEIYPNFNPDIIFRDEERTNEDRMMTQRCKDRLDMLAIWVINKWPGVKLRVTEGWNDPITAGTNEESSLHYEGRAVDITTSDHDRSKYPVLARLAVEAGFDWVHLRSTYVHCSVKSDSSPASVNGGCFPGDSKVPVPGGTVTRLDQLRPGDEVYSIDSSGNIAPDRILTFMDAKRDIIDRFRRERGFVSIRTENDDFIRLTSNHLIYVVSRRLFLESELGFNASSRHRFSSLSTFAAKVQPGDYIYVTSSTNQTSATVRPVRVIEVNHVVSATGAYAPLTERGTIVIENTAASCYAVFESHRIAHMVMTPLRYYHKIYNWLRSRAMIEKWNMADITEFKYFNQNYDENSSGVSYYARILFKIGSNIIPKSLFMET